MKKLILIGYLLVAAITIYAQQTLLNQTESRFKTGTIINIPKGNCQQIITDGKFHYNEWGDALQFPQPDSYSLLFKADDEILALGLKFPKTMGECVCEIYFTYDDKEMFILHSSGANREGVSSFPPPAKFEFNNNKLWDSNYSTKDSTKLALWISEGKPIERYDEVYNKRDGIEFKIFRKKFKGDTLKLTIGWVRVEIKDGKPDFKRYNYPAGASLSNSGNWAKLILPIAIGNNAQQSDFPKLTGSYLGQKPPGMTPEIFAPGIVSTDGAREFSGTFFPGGKEYYFFRFAEGAGMMVTKLVGDRWSVPQPASFNTKYIDNEPHITPDGKYMFFCSNRPFPGSGDQRIMTQVWVMEREGDSWGQPKHLQMGMFATTSMKGNIYMGSTVFRLKEDKLVEVENLQHDATVPMNERLIRQHTCISLDESYHVFDFEENLYVSFRTKEGTWGRPIDLSQRLNLPEGEMLPTISPDNKYLFFCNRGDIYWVSAKIIEELRPKE